VKSWIIKTLVFAMIVGKIESISQVSFLAHLSMTLSQKKMRPYIIQSAVFIDQNKCPQTIPSKNGING